MSIDAILGRLAPLLGHVEPSPAREAIVAALNGVLGDYLAATGNPLAISLRFRRQGKPLALERAAIEAAFPARTGKLLVLAHGLCLNDLQWKRRGHDHGAALARDLGYTPVYLHYNTGLHISTNGRQLAEGLEALLEQWPVPLEDFALVAHSMGGLVARSACHYGALAGHAWPRRLGALVFLGTPHHGAPMERGGNWIDTRPRQQSVHGAVGAARASCAARASPTCATGILPTRTGRAATASRAAIAGASSPLPEGVRCYAIAATTGRRPRGRPPRVARRRDRPARERARPSRRSGPRPEASEIAAVDRPRLRPPGPARPARGIQADPALARRASRRAPPR